MGKVVLHAGMWKTGSTSIQAWLRDHSQELRTDAGVTLLRGTVDPTGSVQLEVHEHGNMQSPEVAQRYQTHPKQRRKLIDELVTQLDDHTRRHGTVVLSAEGLSRPFWITDERFMRALDDLAGTHEVRVAYYVRPQHTSIESSWKQSGFRREDPPSVFAEQECRLLHYFQTYTSVRQLAPRVGFEPRPFRRDLLHKGNVIADFTHTFCGLGATDDMEVWENTSLPLDVVNALHPAPMGLIWLSPRDETESLRELKALIAGLDLPESDRVRLSRQVLQQACHDRFEEDNRRLIDALGWQTDAFVPAVDADIGEASLERLDELWSPYAETGELAVLHHALARLLRTGQAYAGVPAETESVPVTSPIDRVRRRLKRLRSR